MKIDNELIEKIGTLSRLQLEEDETHKLKEQLTRILNHVETLEELELEEVEPLTHPLDLKNIDRTDDIQEGLSQEEALQNAPKRSGDFFEVPRVIGDE